MDKNQQKQLAEKYELEEKKLRELEEEIRQQHQKQLLGLTVKEFKQVKDAILQIKQGEALERDTYPRRLLEALGLGFFSSQTNITLGVIDQIERSLNVLAEIPEDDPSAHLMRDFSIDIAVASGSRGALRLEKSLETIGKLGGGNVYPSKQLPTPEHLTTREPDED